jgi:predicted alpha/beta-fold hydrolase
LDLHVLLNSSIKSIDYPESAATHDMSPEDVKAGLDKISSDTIDSVVQTPMKPTLVPDISTSMFELEKEESNQNFRKQILSLVEQDSDINISLANLNMNESDNDLADIISESAPVPA